MDNLYTNIETLCKSRRITITTMCKESGAARGSLTDLKQGRISTLHPETLRKIASYFGVSVDYLLGNEEAPSITEADIKAAFFNGEKDLSAEEIDELWSETKEFIEFKKAQKRKK